jgi:hypothetical protein
MESSYKHRKCLNLLHISNTKTMKKVIATLAILSIAIIVSAQNVSQQSTKWSLVFDVNNLRLYYKTAPKRETRYVSLMNFDLKCNSDVYMLDVNDMGTGNTFTRFVPYTLELNSQLTRSTYLQLEPQFGPFTEEVLNKIFSYPSTTSCLNN